MIGFMIKNQITEILPGLYLGNYIGALNKNLLKQLGIKHIIQVLSLKYPNPYPNEFQYHNFAIPDLPNYNILPICEKARILIEDYLARGEPVFVHCFQGVSRSTSVIIYYLMVNYKISLHDAYNFVKNKRPIINPNNGFMKQLSIVHMPMKY